MFFTWNKNKYYLKDYYIYNFEDLKEFIKVRELTADILIQAIINIGVENVNFYIPTKCFDSNYGSLENKVKCKLQKTYNGTKIYDCYKVNFKSDELDRCCDFYVNDLVSFVRQGIIEIKLNNK